MFDLTKFKTILSGNESAALEYLKGEALNGPIVLIDYANRIDIAFDQIDFSRGFTWQGGRPSQKITFRNCKLGTLIFERAFFDCLLSLENESQDPQTVRFIRTTFGQFKLNVAGPSNRRPISFIAEGIEVAGSGHNAEITLNGVSANAGMLAQFRAISRVEIENCEITGTTVGLFQTVNSATIKSSTLAGPAQFRSRNVDLSDSCFNNGVSIQGLMENVKIEGCTIKNSLRLEGVTGSKVSFLKLNVLGEIQITNSNIHEFVLNKVKGSDDSANSKCNLRISTPSSISLIASACEFAIVQLASMLSNNVLACRFHDSTIQRLDVAGQEIPSAIKFIRCTISNIDASHAQFRGPLEFKECEFLNAPEFYDAHLFPDTKFVGSTFKDISPRSEAPYRALKFHMADAQNWVEEIRFTSLEMEANWKNLSWIREPAAKFFGFIYFCSNRFGRYLLWPFIWLTVILGFTFTVYRVPGNVIFRASPNDPQWVQAISNWHPDKLGFWYAMINSTGPLKLHPFAQKFIAGGQWVVIISVIHSIVAAYLWFLIFAWIRKRFRTH